MSKKHSKTLRNLPNPTMSSSQISMPYCFYKLMLSPTFPAKKLRIPHAFSRKHGDDLGPRCTLSVPTGETHEVELVEDEEKGDLWFTDGWKEFVKCYNIRYGTFMLFSYDGDSNFSVNIFDVSGCEISYEPSVKEIESEDEASSKVPDFADASAGSDEDELLDGEDDDSDEDENYIISEASGSELSNNTRDSNSDFLTSSDAPQLPIWLCNWNCRKAIQNLRAAGISMPTENPYFVCSIKLSSVHRGLFLSVPIAFARKHLSCPAGDYMTLKMKQKKPNKKWKIKCCRDSGRCTFGTGWIRFARQLSLEVEDVCLFELIDAKHYVFEVQVGHKGVDF